MATDAPAPHAAGPSEPSFEGAGLACWVIALPRPEVMWLRYVLEASEGVGFLSGGADGIVRLVAPDDQVTGVERILADLEAESVPLRVLQRPPAVT